jgi:prophage regulatory protein
MNHNIETPSSNHSSERLLTARDITRHYTLSRSTLWRYTRSGDFPHPVRIGLRRIAWRESDVLHWLETRVQRGRRRS